MNETLCHFELQSDGTCRCVRVGCSNRVRSQDPRRCRAKCKSPARNLLEAPCRYLAAPTGETLRCRGCPGSPRIHALFECAVHGKCIPFGRVRGAVCCETCSQYEPEITPNKSNQPNS